MHRVAAQGWARLGSARFSPHRADYIDGGRCGVRHPALDPLAVAGINGLVFTVAITTVRHTKAVMR
jgi:hypothetical protein